MDTDYRDYDRLFVAVKLNKLGEVERCYRALGWECVDSRDDLVHRGRVHLTYRRPHRVENKDGLQLLQVYMESAMNDEGRLERRLMPRTTAVGVIFLAVALAFAIAGICLVLLDYFNDKPLYYTAGIIFLMCAAATVVLGVIVTLTVFFKERDGRREKLERARTEIFAALNEAEKICKVAVPAGAVVADGSRDAFKEAAVTADSGLGLSGEGSDPSEGGDER